tara:strand:+ start:475 stop:759 length:285 start_codon:yes stop_codon:yes gene_type:complete
MSNLNILNYEITTPKQQKNGTRMFRCPITSDLYGSYSSGYVRRRGKNSKFFYQLNPTVFYSTEKNCKVRVMIKSEKERLEVIKRIAAKRTANDN